MCILGGVPTIGCGEWGVCGEGGTLQNQREPSPRTRGRHLVLAIEAGDTYWIAHCSQFALVILSYT